MAGKKQFPNGTWQYIFKRKGVLDKPLYLTFASEAEGDEYAARLDALLARGIVPAEHQKTDVVRTIKELVREYERDAHPSPKDRSALRTIVDARGHYPLSDINAAWVDAWITEMKRVESLAPATIRAKVGALARCTDWGMRKGLLSLPDHPLRSLPDGYAQYTKTDAALAAGGARHDVERDRRLEPGEYEAILAKIDEGVLARKQRPLKLEHQASLRCIFVIAVETAMRMREMYTLTHAQVDLPRRTVFLDKTKNGDKRQVPLSTVAVKMLQEYLAGLDKEKNPQSLIFPWWSGDPADLHDTSDYLSSMFSDIMEQAGAHGLRFHDLRHEAVSRLFERTKLSEAQIMKITGHKSHRMLMRYANLRGTDLANSLW
ncbi:site-specific integrase [Delftia sp. PS-11]|uniref:site-specific integrase n=1 Tax=Delftia sp. PS-11 TaxID=2767222 RepID=UPI00245481BF|nr:site-specific integrase [Delftia sp. PS-11]KAJ8745406.1 site-specific integrase [Delftia sp. PS-11]